MAFIIYWPLLSNQCFSGVLLTFNNKKNSFNDLYSNMHLPCMRVCKTIMNQMNFFLSTWMILNVTKVMTNSKFHPTNGFSFLYCAVSSNSSNLFKHLQWSCGTIVLQILKCTPQHNTNATHKHKEKKWKGKRNDEI